MCGLVGIFDSVGERPIDPLLLSRLNDTLVHRGPDGAGQHLAPGIGLAHRRLAIIDLGGGAQPLFNEDGNVAVVFNGEIYNFHGLADELQAKGHKFRTRCDTEVIVHGWEEWGPACVERFHGMFAFALWDAARRTLFVARDRMGKKPFYYTRLNDGQVVFGSEMKALLKHPDVRRTLDPQAVEEYFAYGYVPDPRSIFKDVRKLPPAHRMVWQRGSEPRIEPYWDVAMGVGPHRSVGEAAEDLDSRLHAAVGRRLISDVPLGAFLSGGVDSSGVVAHMAGLMNEPVRTFTIGFGHRAFDETEYARIIAERYKTDHHVREVSPDFYDQVDRLSEMYDEPFGDSSALPTFRVCALARENVTVALSGDGGDELFAGYRRYLWHVREERVRGILPRALRKPMFGLLAKAYPKLDWAPRYLRAKTTFQELALDPETAYFVSVSVLRDSVRHAIYSDRMKAELQGYHAIEVLRRHMRAAGTDHPLLQAQYADLKTWLAGDILVKVDRASMASSLEVRAPMLDHEMVEWAAGLDPDLKLNHGAGKFLLKKALEKHVPHDLLYRPKQGFSIPLAAWFRGPLAERMRAAVTGPVLAETGLFDMAVLTRLVDQHQSGLSDHSPTLWVVLMFESFLRRVVGLGPAAV